MKAAEPKNWEESEDEFRGNKLLVSHERELQMPFEWFCIFLQTSINIVAWFKQTLIDDQYNALTSKVASDGYHSWQEVGELWFSQVKACQRNDASAVTDSLCGFRVSGMWEIQRELGSTPTPACSLQGGWL